MTTDELRDEPERSSIALALAARYTARGIHLAQVVSSSEEFNERNVGYAIKCLDLAERLSRLATASDHHG